MTAPGPEAVLAANRPWWEAEAAVCRAWFEHPGRTPAGDRRWLARQAAKELHDGVLVRLDVLARWRSGGTPDGRGVGAWVAAAAELHEEASHLAAFAAAHDALCGPDDAPLDVDALADLAAWPGNTALGAVRAEHRRTHPRLGGLAAYVTEGGGGALYREGAARAGGVHPGDDAVAAACAAVLADEDRHAGDALDRLAALDLAGDEWALVRTLTVEQSRARLRMRHEQFGEPLPPEGFAALLRSCEEEP